MRAPRRRLLVAALAAALGALSGATSGGADPSGSAPSLAPASPPLPRSRFSAPRGCRNLTLIGYPSAGFPRVLPLTRLCPFEPRTDCHGEAVAQRSRLALREGKKTPKRDALKWRLKKGQATTPAD